MLIFGLRLTKMASNIFSEVKYFNSPFRFVRFLRSNMQIVGIVFKFIPSISKFWIIEFRVIILWRVNYGIVFSYANLQRLPLNLINVQTFQHFIYALHSPLYTLSSNDFYVILCKLYKGIHMYKFICIQWGLKSLYHLAFLFNSND